MKNGPGVVLIVRHVKYCVCVLRLVSVGTRECEHLSILLPSSHSLWFSHPHLPVHDDSSVCVLQPFVKNSVNGILGYIIPVRL
jgi:hypothetical protein